MAVTVTNFVAGPGTLYTGAVGATEPLDTAVGTAPSSPTWTDMGGIDGGVNITHVEEYMLFTCDDVNETIGRRQTKSDVTISTNLVEPTLANLAILRNGGTVTTGAGNTTYDPAAVTAATVFAYKALILDGWAPGSTSTTAFRRRLIVRKALSVESVQAAFKKDGQTMFPVTFAAHYVSSAIKSFHYVDQTT